jgi:hypothetical protein
MLISGVKNAGHVLNDVSKGRYPLKQVSLLLTMINVYYADTAPAAVRPLP